MAENSKIEWTKHTANLWWGCTEVHAGCDNCYARVLSHRWGEELWGNESPRRPIKSVWKDLSKYQKIAAAAGEMHRVFVGSMMDIFEKPMSLIGGGTTDTIRRKLFLEISEGYYDNLMFLFLTKRPSNINKYIPAAWKEEPPHNVMFGTSPVDQKTYNKLVPQLLEVNGKRFLSVEPMLGPIFMELDAFIPEMTTNENGFVYERVRDKIHWVICGGESGIGRRPFNPVWARDLRDQCSLNNTPFFMKQMDKIIPIPEDLLIRQYYK